MKLSRFEMSCPIVDAPHKTKGVAKLITFIEPAVTAWNLIA